MRRGVEKWSERESEGVGGDELVGAVINVGAIGTLCAARRPHPWQ